MNMNKFLCELGNEVRDRRRALGYSQESFAGEVGLHRTYIGSIERGERNVSIENVIRIADALGLAGSTLIRHSEERLKRDS